jgi:hypothetical protein
MVRRFTTLILPYTLEQKKQVASRLFSYIRRIERCDGRHRRRCIMSYSLCEALQDA